MNVTKISAVPISANSIYFKGDNDKETKFNKEKIKPLAIGIGATALVCAGLFLAYRGQSQKSQRTLQEANEKLTEQNSALMGRINSLLEETSDKISSLEDELSLNAAKFDNLTVETKALRQNEAILQDGNFRAVFENEKLKQRQLNLEETNSVLFSRGETLKDEVTDLIYDGAEMLQDSEEVFINAASAVRRIQSAIQEGLASGWESVSKKDGRFYMFFVPEDGSNGVVRELDKAGRTITRSEFDPNFPSTVYSIREYTDRKRFNKITWDVLGTRQVTVALDCERKSDMTTAERVYNFVIEGKAKLKEAYIGYTKKPNILENAQKSFSYAEFEEGEANGLVQKLAVVSTNSSVFSDHSKTAGKTVYLPNNLNENTTSINLGVSKDSRGPFRHICSLIFSADGNVETVAAPPCGI